MRVLSTQTGMVPVKSSLANVIKDMCGRPRSLKQLSRVVIYKEIGAKPALNAAKLPLPQSLREFVIRQLFFYHGLENLYRKVK